MKYSQPFSIFSTALILIIKLQEYSLFPQYKYRRNFMQFRLLFLPVFY